MPPILLDAREVAEKIDSTYEEVLRLHRLGHIPSIKVGGRIFFNFRRVVEAIRQRQEAEAGQAGAA